MLLLITFLFLTKIGHFNPNLTMNTLSFMPLAFVGMWEVIIIALVVLLLFGGKKIPELMKGLGKGVKSFKEGMKDVENDVNEIKKDIQSEK